MFQSVKVLDNPLFTVQNGPEATLHQLQNASNIACKFFLHLNCFPRPQDMNFQLPNFATWIQHGPIWRGSGAPTVLQSPFSYSHRCPTWPPGWPQDTQHGLQSGPKMHNMPNMALSWHSDAQHGTQDGIKMPRLGRIWVWGCVWVWV